MLSDWLLSIWQFKWGLDAWLVIHQYLLKGLNELTEAYDRRERSTVESPSQPLLMPLLQKTGSRSYIFLMPLQPGDPTPHYIEGCPCHWGRSFIIQKSHVTRDHLPPPTSSPLNSGSCCWSDPFFFSQRAGDGPPIPCRAQRTWSRE